MTQNLVKDLEHLAEHEAPSDFVSALDTYFQRYVKGNRDLDELAKHWDSGMLAERSPRKPGYIVKRRFQLSEAAERGRRVCGLEEMTQQGVLGKRQKRSPQCEQVGRLYQLAGAKWLSLRMEIPSEIGISGFRRRRKTHSNVYRKRQPLLPRARVIAELSRKGKQLLPTLRLKMSDQSLRALRTLPLLGSSPPLHPLLTTYRLPPTPRLSTLPWVPQSSPKEKLYP
jgi:hypothetical protein